MLLLFTYFLDRYQGGVEGFSFEHYCCVDVAGFTLNRLARASID